ncbi:unnamed protein product [Boreogadus saida]
MENLLLAFSSYYFYPSPLSTSWDPECPCSIAIRSSQQDVLRLVRWRHRAYFTQYFIWHVVHHKHLQLYRWVHAIHHEYILSSFSWSAEQLSIPELMAVGFWGNLDPVLLGCHPLTTWCVTVFSIWMSVEDHIGYDLPWMLNRVVPFGLLGGAPAHDMHHQKPGCNFAPFFRHWDRIFGTAAPVYINAKKLRSGVSENTCLFD